MLKGSFLLTNLKRCIVFEKNLSSVLFTEPKVIYLVVTVVQKLLTELEFLPFILRFLELFPFNLCMKPQFEIVISCGFNALSVSLNVFSIGFVPCSLSVSLSPLLVCVFLIVCSFTLKVRFLSCPVLGV